MQPFDYAGVLGRTGRRILEAESPRTSHGDRGHDCRLTGEEVQHIIDFAETYGFEAARMTCGGMAAEAGVSVDVHPRTVQRHMNEEDMYKHKACQRQSLSPRNAAKREEYARKCLEHRPNPEDWRDVRWSDEFHLGFGPEGLAWVARRKVERYEPYNI